MNIQEQLKSLADNSRTLEDHEAVRRIAEKAIQLRDAGTDRREIADHFRRAVKAESRRRCRAIVAAAKYRARI